MHQRRLTREERKQQTRTSLLDAAAEVFSRRGFHAASVDEVAETAGFSKGAVYSNFASKEDLFLALLDRRLAHEVVAWDTISRHIGAPPEEPARNQPSFATAIGEDRTWNLLVIEFFLYAMRDDRVRPKLAARFHDLRQVMREQLTPLFAAHGRTPTLPIPYLPWIIFALGAGLSIQGYLDPDALPADLYERALEHVLR